MSNLATHEAEQAAITTSCEAGTCEHPDCKLGALELAQQISDAEGLLDDNRRRAARALLCYLPAYEDEPKASLSDFLADAMHLCDLAGWDFAELTASARRNYMLELAECGIAAHPTFARAIADA